MTEAPERIWLNTYGDYAGAYEAMAGTETGVTWCDMPQDDGDEEYLRADIAAAQVAAAYERAADRACERLADSWTWDDADFLACVIADLKRHLAALATDTQADALEQVRREAERSGYERGARLARNMALIEAAGKCDVFDGPVSKSEFVNGQSTAAQQIRAAILSLMTPDEQTEAARELAFRKAVSS